MEDKEWQKRYIEWLEYWCRAIREQHEEDKEAIISDGSERGTRFLYRDDTDRAINGLIVASLLEEMDRLERQIKRVG